MKKRSKLSIVLLILAALVIMQLPRSEADAETSASDFKIEGSTLVKYRGTQKDVTIPDTVKVIGKSAFEDNDQVERVVIPDSVDKIEEYAFWGCDNLHTVLLGKGLSEIGDYSFANCMGLTQLTVPANVHSIGMEAFADCVNMTDITIPPEVTSIHDTAFDGCARLVIHSAAGSVADTYASAFYEKQAEMPEYEDVTSYPTTSDEAETPTDSGEEMPAGDSTSNSSTMDGESSSQTANEQTGFSAQNDTAGSKVLGTTQIVGNRAVVFMDAVNAVVLDGNATIEVPPASETDSNGDGSNSGNGREELPKYTIVDGTIVADQAYYRSQKLSAVVVPDGVQEIGQFSFARSSLERMSLPESVTTISYGAFYHCDHLEQVSLPESIQCIEPMAFTHTAWMDSFLQNPDQKFLIAGHCLIAYQGEDQDIAIPDDITVIAGNAFLGASNLKSVNLPESLQVIGEGAFENCTSLSKVTFGSNVSHIKDRAFQNCDLQNVNLPASVSTVGLQAFDENTKVVYEGGQTPVSTYETSAQRLSNESYRNPGEDTQTPGVSVEGITDASAHLAGAARAYTLQLTQKADATAFERAYERTYGEKAPSSYVDYGLTLTDQSKIPITKLGKQELTLTLPIPDGEKAADLKVFTMDRNGQLMGGDAGNVSGFSWERTTVDGKDCIQIHLSFIGEVVILSL